MRAFIAIEIPVNVKDVLTKLQNKRVSSFSKVNWVHRKNLHLTLKFIPDLLESDIEKIKELLSQIKFKPFSVSLGDIGFFPNPDYIRIVWIGLTPENPILELQQDIEMKLSAMLIKDDEFAVHLTLGRVKYIKDMKQFKELISNIDYEKIGFEIKGFKFYRSDLTKDGPKYTELGSF